MFGFYDLPHIYKNIRTAHLKHKISTDYGVVDSDVVRYFFALDQQSNSRLCPKLTERHINPSSADTMKVSLATQLLSESVAVGVLITAKLNKFPKKFSKTWYPTFMFLLNFNRGFDCLNSYTENHRNNYKTPLKPGSFSYNYLKNEFLPYLNRLKVQTKNTLYCFDGLKQSTNAALQLADDKFSDLNCKDKSVKTRKLGSDPVEQFFATVRQRNGFNNEPSVAEFGATVARISSQNIRSFSGTSQNCEPAKNLERNYKSIESIESHLENTEFIDSATSEEAQNQENEENFVNGINLLSEDSDRFIEPNKINVSETTIEQNEEFSSSHENIESDSDQESEDEEIFGGNEENANLKDIENKYK